MGLKRFNSSYINHYSRYRKKLQEFKKAELYDSTLPPSSHKPHSWPQGIKLCGEYD